MPVIVAIDPHCLDLQGLQGLVAFCNQVVIISLDHYVSFAKQHKFYIWRGETQHWILPLSKEIIPSQIIVYENNEDDDKSESTNIEEEKIIAKNKYINKQIDSRVGNQ